MKRIGIICPAEIAYRRFMPALIKSKEFNFIGIAVADDLEWQGDYNETIRCSELEKAEMFTKKYGGTVFKNYYSLINSNDVDAIYLPLPPSLHFKWGKSVLENGKHLLIEKPSSTNLCDTKKLIEIANRNNLAIHENYMFKYHNQVDYIINMMNSGKIGHIRLIRAAFGFPERKSCDFRYNRSMGGGALLDCGGYPLKLVQMLLGNTAKITTSRLNYTSKYNVDIYGTATIENENGTTAQISFGMDNSYKCELEIWGSKGTIFTNRIFTAPPNLEPIIELKNNDQPTQAIMLKPDDSFCKSINNFSEQIENPIERKKSYIEIIKQMEMVESFKNGL